MNSFEFNSWKGKFARKLSLSLIGTFSLCLKSWHCWWIELDVLAVWLSIKCSPSCSLHFAHIDCLLMSQDFLSAMYCLPKLGLNKSGLSEHSCSHSHMEQCFLDKSHRTLIARFVAYCCSSSFFIALVTGPVNSECALKLKLSDPETVLFSMSAVSSGCLKNFLILIMLRIFILPFGNTMRALESLISVIFAGPCHFGVNFMFFSQWRKIFIPH